MPRDQRGVVAVEGVLEPVEGSLAMDRPRQLSPSGVVADPFGEVDHVLVPDVGRERVDGQQIRGSGAVRARWLNGCGSCCHWEALRPMKEAEITAEVVRCLLAEQVPTLAGLPVTPVEVDGWDNTTFRVGSEHLVRLPSDDGYVPAVDKEHRWLPHLGPALPLPIPTPVSRAVRAAVSPGLGRSTVGCQARPPLEETSLM